MHFDHNQNFLSDDKFPYDIHLKSKPENFLHSELNIITEQIETKRTHF